MARSVNGGKVGFTTPPSEIAGPPKSAKPLAERFLDDYKRGLNTVLRQKRAAEASEKAVPVRQKMDAAMFDARAKERTEAAARFERSAKRKIRRGLRRG